MGDPVKLGKIFREIMKRLERKRIMLSEKPHNLEDQREVKKDEDSNRYPRAAAI